MRLGLRDLPLLFANRLVTSFAQGWQATSLYTGFAPLFLLQFENADGGRGGCFLNYQLDRKGGAVHELSPELRSLLRLHAAPLLRRLLEQVLYRIDPQLDPELRDFLEIYPDARSAICDLCKDELISSPSLYLHEHLQPHSLVFRGDDRELRSIDRQSVALSLDADWQDRLVEGLLDGRLTWPSPVDGAQIAADGSLPLDDFHILYRFSDRRHHLVFFVMVGDHRSQALGLWFPSMSLIISRDQAHRAAIETHFLPRLSWLVQHVVHWADRLVPYLSAGPRRFASVLRTVPAIHIGHQLWNELTGVDAAVRAVPDNLPEWLVLDPDGGTDSELYGPLDELYPELEGRVNRQLRSLAGMIGWVYENDVLLIRMVRQTVSAGLRARIQARVAQHKVARDVLERVARSRDGLQAGRTGRRPMTILLGLRVENRTVVDLAGFLEALVDHVVVHHPGTTLVFDGHNALGQRDDGRVIASHGEQHARQSPVEVERALVARIRAFAVDLPVTIIDTIGRPMSTSLAWASACDCFVSIWGASLAKYRWVCNKPGFVLSSRKNLLERADLRIYDSAAYMDDPTELVFADPDLITDDPEDDGLLSITAGQASFRNFRVDAERLLPEIGAFIAKHGDKLPQSVP